MNNYQAYLLRLQRHPERKNWQVTLENVETRDRQYFANMEAALRYLEEHLRLVDTLEQYAQIDPLKGKNHV